MARLKRVKIRIGDTLQGIAARELGDALRWRDLVAINRLRPPYLISSLDPSDRQPQTVIWGDTLLVPATNIGGGAVLGEDALGQDVRVVKGQLAVSTAGDLAVVSGAANLQQALCHRLMTPYRSYLLHPDYGCEIHALLGMRHGVALAALGAALVRRAMARDPRVQEAAAKGAVDADHLLIQAEARSVEQDTVTDLNLIYLLPVT